MDIRLIVKRRQGNKCQYLSRDMAWSNDVREARQYLTTWSFHDAENRGGSVFLLFANGKQIPVSVDEVFVLPKEGCLQ